MSSKLKNASQLPLVILSVAIIAFDLSACSKKKPLESAQTQSESASEPSALTQESHSKSRSISDHPANPTAPVATHANIAPGAPTSPSAATAPTAPALPAGPECFTFNFRHKPVASHSTEDDCSHHKNRIKLQHESINKSSVCVRVDNTPVRFEMIKGKELLFGAVAGPKSKITVKYCLGKAKCAEDCTIPKDEFMAAIGGDAEDNGAVGKWEGSENEKTANVHAHIDGELKRELADVDSAISKVFTDWISESEAASCSAGRTVARAK